MPHGWCATRERPLPHDEEYAGMSRTLVADNSEALVAQLHRQAEIEVQW